MSEELRHLKTLSEKELHSIAKEDQLICWQPRSKAESRVPNMERFRNGVAIGGDCDGEDMFAWSDHGSELFVVAVAKKLPEV